jgi:hypothetical protein
LSVHLHVAPLRGSAAPFVGKVPNLSSPSNLQARLRADLAVVARHDETWMAAKPPRGRAEFGTGERQGAPCSDDYCVSVDVRASAPTNFRWNTYCDASSS